MVFHDVFKPDSMSQEILSIALLLHTGCNARRKDKLDFSHFLWESLLPTISVEWLSMFTPLNSCIYSHCNISVSKH